VNNIVNNINSIFRSQSADISVETLIKENETLQAILNSLSEGVIVADKDGNFLYFNPVAENILGIGLQKIDQDEWASVYGTFNPDKNKGNKHASPAN